MNPVSQTPAPAACKAERLSEEIAAHEACRAEHIPKSWERGGFLGRRGVGLSHLSSTSCAYILTQADTAKLEKNKADATEALQSSVTLLKPFSRGFGGSVLRGCGAGMRCRSIRGRGEEVIVDSCCVPSSVRDRRSWLRSACTRE